MRILFYQTFPLYLSFFFPAVRNPTPVIGFIWVHIRTSNQTSFWGIFDHLKDSTPAFLNSSPVLVRLLWPRHGCSGIFGALVFRPRGRRIAAASCLRRCERHGNQNVAPFESDSNVFFTGKSLNFRPQVVPQVVACSKSETTEYLSVETANRLVTFIPSQYKNRAGLSSIRNVFVI